MNVKLAVVQPRSYYGDDEYGDEFEIITSGVTFDCAGHIIHQGGLRIGYGENNVTIRNCYINNYTDGFGGIYLWHANNATIENNTITGCVRGIKLSYSDDCTVTGNTTNSSEFHGIDISDSDGSQVTGNTCNSNTWGIGLDESNNSTVTGNTANSNEHAGIELDE